MKTFLLILLFVPLAIFAQGDVSNVLIYTDPVQVSASLNAYQQPVAGVPLEGSLMVTHNKGTLIAQDSFRFGDKPLAVTYVETTAMSPYSPLVVTIYRFRLEGMAQGSYTLPPITVKVGGKEYQANPLNVQIGP